MVSWEGPPSPSGSRDPYGRPKVALDVQKAVGRPTTFVDAQARISGTFVVQLCSMDV